MRGGEKEGIAASWIRKTSGLDKSYKNKNKRKNFASRLKKMLETKIVGKSALVQACLRDVDTRKKETLEVFKKIER